jgi:uncharacterized delta-60 repeat protein
MAGRLRLATLVAVLAAACLAPPALAAPGDLDTSWDTDGKVTNTTVLSVKSLAIQSDGKVVIAARGSSNLSLFRFNTDGSPDTSFDGDGRVDLDAGGTEDSAALVIQPADQKIVLVGSSNANNGDFAVARFNADGSPDTTFGGGDGVETTDIGTNTSDGAKAVALQADGKIVVAGSSDSGGDPDWTVVRYNADGSLDTTSFGGGDGKVVQDIAGTFDTVAGVGVQSGGRIVVGGYTVTGGNFVYAVAGFTSAGVLDSSYGAAGIRTKDLGGVDQAFGFAMQSDGKALVSGRKDSDNFGLARFDADGGVDTGFGTNGAVTTPFDSFTQGTAVAVQSNGRIVMVGITGDGGCCDFAIARYEADGTLDSTFGTGGKVTTDFGSDDGAESVAINPANGRIVVGGGTASGSCECSLAAIAAYLGDPPPPPAENPPPEQPPPQQPPPADPCANDHTGPKLTIKSNQNKELYRQNDAGSVRISATDTSGLKNDPSDPSRPISTKTVGVQSVTASATDNCNNTTTTTFSYRVAGDPEIGIEGVRATCTTSSFLATVRIVSDVSLKSVTVRLDGRLIAQGKGKRLTVRIPIDRVSEGRHVLTVAARDRAGNRSTERANFARCVTVTPHFTG